MAVPTEEPAVNAAPEKHLTDIITIMDQNEETNKKNDEGLMVVDTDGYSGFMADGKRATQPE